LAGLESRGIDPVITRAAIDGQLVGGVGMKDGHRSAGAGDQDSPSADRKQIDRVVAGGAVESVPVRSLIVMVAAPPRAWTRIRSTPLRSIVTLPASRERSTREPLAEIVMVSSIFAPRKSSLSKPA